MTQKESTKTPQKEVAKDQQGTTKTQRAAQSDPSMSIFQMRRLPIFAGAWMLDHDARSYALITRVFDGQAESLTRDDILDNVTLYWLTNTAVSSARIYWENKFGFFSPKHVAIPVAVSAFPDEVLQTPRSWTEQAYPNLIMLQQAQQGRPLRGLGAARTLEP